MILVRKALEKFENTNFQARKSFHRVYFIEGENP
jgi:hypothetical protein